MPAYGKQKRSCLTVPYGSRQDTLVDASLLRWTSSGKGIASIEVCITKDEIERAMIFGRSGFGDYFDSAAARPLKFSRIWVLINLYFFDSRWRDTEVWHFHAVHNQRHSIRSHAGGIEKPRHGADVVLIKNGQVTKRLFGERNGIFVVGGFRADLSWRRCNGRLLPHMPPLRLTMFYRGFLNKRTPRRPIHNRRYLPFAHSDLLFADNVTVSNDPLDSENYLEALSGVRYCVVRGHRCTRSALRIQRAAARSTSPPLPSPLHDLRGANRRH